jgi:hypothetical protein
MKRRSSEKRHLGIGSQASKAKTISVKSGVMVKQNLWRDGVGKPSGIRK